MKKNNKSLLHLLWHITSLVASDSRHFFAFATVFVLWSLLLYRVVVCVQPGETHGHGSHFVWRVTFSLILQELPVFWMLWNIISSILFCFSFISDKFTFDVEHCRSSEQKSTCVWVIKHFNLFSTVLFLLGLALVFQDDFFRGNSDSLCP